MAISTNLERRIFVSMADPDAGRELCDLLSGATAPVYTADVSLTDGTDLVFGTGLDAMLRWSTADADNHTLVIALGDDNQSVHITDKGAIATDWNVAANTHPTVYIHSNTTPATHYLAIGGHDGTTAHLDVRGGTTLALRVGGTTLVSLTATTMTLTDAHNIVLGTTTGTKIGTATTQKIGFYNATPVTQPAALTAQDTTITHTAPGTPDFAIQNLTSTSPFGFVTQDEGNTVLRVIANLQVRLAEVEARLESLGLVAAN